MGYIYYSVNHPFLVTTYEKSCISISFRFVYELKISRKKKKNLIYHLREY